MSDVRLHHWPSGVLITALAVACSQQEGKLVYESDNVATCVPTECTLDEQYVRSTAATFLNDVAARREALETSLLYPDNTYATERLAAYAIDGKWETLPEFDAPTAALSLDANNTVIASEYQTWTERTFERAETGWPKWSLEDWLDAGEFAFFGYPAQHLGQLDSAVGLGDSVSLEVLDSLGVWRDANASLGGLVSARYADGTQAVNVTCATCHARPDATGALIVGAPSRIDLSPSPDVTWGPGKVDVTADGVTNAVAVADLRATRLQRRLHYTGNVENSLLALAVRVETLLITSHGGAVRPPRELAFSLAVYIWSLGTELASRAPSLEAAATEHPTAAALFEARCASCHAGPWGEGEWAPLSAVKTEPLVAESTARGTGGYRIPTLLGFSERHLSHEARNAGLAAWLNGETPEDAHAGHAYLTRGSQLTEAELAALTAYLHAAFPAR